MTDDPRTRLIALLMRLDAPDLAAQLWRVRYVRELSADVRAAIYDVVGTAAAGGWRERELDELARVLELDEGFSRPRGRSPVPDQLRRDAAIGVADEALGVRQDAKPRAVRAHREELSAKRVR